MAPSNPLLGEADRIPIARCPPSKALQSWPPVNREASCSLNDRADCLERDARWQNSPAFPPPDLLAAVSGLRAADAFIIDPAAEDAALLGAAKSGEGRSISTNPAPKQIPSFPSAGPV